MSTIHMIYAVTGHTQGIGKRLFDRLSPNAVGFSRSTGYDISDKSIRYKIIDESQHCDVFINNAHHDFCQTYLLLELLYHWKDKPNKTIINIGSRVSEVVLNDNFFHLAKYQAEKIALKETVAQMSKFVKCQVHYKWFGYVGTEKILAKYPHFTQKDYISLDTAVDIILS